MSLAYVERGTGPVVVLLHGFPLSKEMWRHQLDALAVGYRVIAPDLPGHGESPAPDRIYEMDAMADEVVALLDRLGIVQPVVLGGLSMGGYVALALLRRHPERVRGLLLMDTRAAADTPDAARMREETARGVLQSKSTSVMIETMVPRLFGKTTLEKHPGKIGPILAVMERTTPQGVAGALRGMAVRPDRRGELGEIAVPTLVLVGEDDVISPPAEAREIAAAIPGARIEVIPNAGHLAPYENPSAANAAIQSFLESLDAPDLAARADP
jgi:pimeloyl-ACP methyl ester carboxylesterase